MMIAPCIALAGEGESGALKSSPASPILAHVEHRRVEIGRDNVGID